MATIVTRQGKGTTLTWAEMDANLTNINQELVMVNPVTKYGAIGDGVTDDTLAITNAIIGNTSIFFPGGTYLFTGDMDSLYALNISGPGLISYNGYLYRASKNTALNEYWGTELSCWTNGHASAVSSTQRLPIPVGATTARENFDTGVTISHVTGQYFIDAIRIQRDSGNAVTSPANIVFNLTREETKKLVGKDITLQFNAKKGSTYSGSALSYRIQYSIEQEQPILNANGTYTNGNTNAKSSSVIPTTSFRYNSAPYFDTASIPTNVTQVSIVFSIDWSGVAGANDYIEIEGIAITIGTSACNVLRESFTSLLAKSRTRFQSSYPYGVLRGSVMDQGSEQAIAINTNANWAFAMPIRFSPPMIHAPQFIFQASTSSTESRVLNKDAGATLNGIAFDLADTGVTITNNGAATAGNRYVCNWTAQVIF